MIPKIIHQIAPLDDYRWHPVWKICHQTVRNTFNDFQLFLWGDGEDIGDFVRDRYPEHFEFYSSLPSHIERIDFSRYCILDYYGGIYADMDMFFYKNPYQLLNDNSYLLNPFSFDDSPVIMNCFMVANEKSTFFKKVIEECKNNYTPHEVNTLDDVYQFTTKTTGPKFLYQCYEKYSDLVELLDMDTYHAPIYKYNENIISKHLKTQIWGDECFFVMDKLFRSMNISSEEGLLKCFNEVRGIDIKNFDFYRDYD